MESPAPGPLARRATGRLLLLACLLHGLAYLALLPPWMGEDEPWHYEFVEHVASGARPEPLRGVRLTQADVDRHPFSQLQVQRRFPSLAIDEIARVQREVLASMTRARFWQRVDWVDPLAAPASFDAVHEGFTATNQPVGYYLLAGAWLALAPFDAPEARLLWVRVLSLAFYLATCAVALAAARLVFADERVALLAALAVAWLPLNARAAAIASNDPLARLVASAAFLLALVALRRRRATPPSGPSPAPTSASPSHARLAGAALPLGAVALCGAAFLVKTTAVPVTALALVVVLGARVSGLAPRRALPWAALALATLAAGVLYWYHQHNPAMPRSLEALSQRIERGLAPESWNHLWFTSIGRFNWESRYLPGRWYWWIFQVLRALVVLGLVGALRLRGARLPLALAALALALQLGAIVARGVAVGRYLLPAAVPLGLLLAAGAVALLPRRARGGALAVGAALLVLWDAAFLWTGLALNQYVAWRG